MVEQVVPYHVVCPICKSPNVTADASARWDFASQKWELSTYYDRRSCDDCGHESNSFDAVPDHKLTEAQRLTIETGDAYVRTQS